MNMDFNTFQDSDDFLNNLSIDLIMDNIDEQMMSKRINVDYLETIKDKIVLAMEENADDGEAVTKLRELSDDVAVKVMELIEQHSGIDIDIDNIEPDVDNTLLDIASALYTFFVIDYSDNIKNFYHYYILANKKSLSEELGLNDTSKKRKEKPLYSQNVTSVIKLIRDMDIDGYVFLDYCSEEDDYSNYIMRTLLDRNIIDDDFVEYFFSYLNDNIDEIVFHIQSILNKNK